MNNIKDPDIRLDLCVIIEREKRDDYGL